MQSGKDKSIKIMLIVIAAGLLLASMILMLQGQRSSALTVTALASAILVLFWGFYLLRRESGEQ